MIPIPKFLFIISPFQNNFRLICYLKYLVIVIITRYDTRFNVFLRVSALHRLFAGPIVIYIYFTPLRAREVAPELVKALAGHTRHDVTEGYNHILRDTFVEAVELRNDLFWEGEE